MQPFVYIILHWYTVDGHDMMSIWGPESFFESKIQAEKKRDELNANPEWSGVTYQVETLERAVHNYD